MFSQSSEEHHSVAAPAIAAVTAVAVASDHHSNRSSIASSYASSDDAITYDVAEAELNTSAEPVLVEDVHRVSHIDVTTNSIPDVTIISEPAAYSSEVEYVNSAVLVDSGYAPVVEVTSPQYTEYTEVSAPAEAVSNAQEYLTSTTTTREVITVTSEAVRDSGHIEVPVVAPPPTEFTDIQNGSGSNRSSTTTISEGYNQYAVTTEEVTTEEVTTEHSNMVNEFMSSSSEPVVIRTTTTSSSYSYVRGHLMTHPYGWPPIVPVTSRTERCHIPSIPSIYISFMYNNSTHYN